MVQTVGSDGSQGGRVMRMKLTGGTFPGMKPTAKAPQYTRDLNAKKPKPKATKARARSK